MLLYEYDERKHLKNTYEEGIQKGMRTGQYKGRQQKAYQTARNLYRRGFSIKDTAGILEEDEKMVAAWFKNGKQRGGGETQSPSPASSMAFPISCRIY